MTQRARARKLRRQRGFTLAFTIMLTLVLTVMAAAILTKVFVGLRSTSFNKERANTLDAASIGLYMAMDEISPGIERMRNAVWSTMTSDGNAAAATTSYYYALNQLSGSATNSQPVREMVLFANVRNWEPFADWSKSYGTNGWDKGWQYVPRDATPEYFDAAENPRIPVQVGGTATTGSYWYGQITPPPPVLANGAPAAPATWANRAEYPEGIFAQPVLRKVYTVRSNPRTRVAVYVQVSLQDYYDVDPTTSAYRNVAMADKCYTSATNSSFDLANFSENNTIAFSIFAVSEGTHASRPIRLHQSLNVAMGGAEFLTVSGGLDAATMSDDPAAYVHSSPFFPPTLDTPRGDNYLIAGTPIRGQVYTASGDLRFNFADTISLGHSATRSAVFLYERIDLPKTAACLPPNAVSDTSSGSPKVVFLIERVPPTAGGGYRRRLIFDWPDAVIANRGAFGGTTGNSDSDNPSSQICWVPASYSAPTDADASGGSAIFPSMYIYADRAMPPMSPFCNQWPYYEWFDGHFDPADTSQTRFPYTTTIASTGSFMVSTASAPNNYDVLNWPSNPLCNWDSSQQTFVNTALASSMPWQGPTIPIRHPGAPEQDATVSYYVTWWPHRTPSNRYSQVGARLGLSFMAATQSVR